MAFKQIFGDAFAFGLGYGLASFILALLGLGIAAGGYILLQKETSKEKDQQKDHIKIIAYVLMGVGIALLGGIGIAFLFSQIEEEL